MPSCSGAGPRGDASRVVALDGLLSDAECHALLCWLVGEKLPDSPEHPIIVRRFCTLHFGRNLLLFMFLVDLRRMCLLYKYTFVFFMSTCLAPAHRRPSIQERHLARNWEQRCVDFAGAPPTWGLKAEVLRRLRDEPPPPVQRLQARLQALYPEYHLAFMPGAGLADEEDEEGGTPLSSFVGNAVVAGQHCDWHQDMDPACLPPMSPWVQQHSWYYNREVRRDRKKKGHRVQCIHRGGLGNMLFLVIIIWDVCTSISYTKQHVRHTACKYQRVPQPGKPLFVSMLLYLNRTWAPELHAETLFVDPDSGTGVFVQPRPGRVVLMDQDVPHRIGAASPTAGDQPRFSLVWKLVFWPQQDYAQGLAGGQLQEMSLARRQWGPAVHLGSPSNA